MAGKVLAALLLIFGGGATLYILYKAALALLHPVVQKKLEQKMQKEKYEQLENNLQLHQQPDQNQVRNTQQNMKGKQ